MSPTGHFLLFLLCLDWGYRCLERKQEKWSALFITSHHIKGTCYPHDIIVDVDFHHLVIVVLARILYCKVICPPFPCSILGNKSLSLVHSQWERVFEAKGEELSSTSFRGKYPHIGNNFLKKKIECSITRE